MAAGGSQGGAQGVEAGKAFVRVQAKNEVQAGLADAGHAVREFGEKSKKTINELRETSFKFAKGVGDEGGLVGALLGESGALGGAGGLAGLVGVLGPAGLLAGGLTLMVSKVGEIREQTKKLLDDAAEVNARLTTQHGKEFVAASDFRIERAKQLNDLLEREAELRREVGRIRADDDRLEQKRTGLLGRLSDKPSSKRTEEDKRILRDIDSTTDEISRLFNQRGKVEAEIEANRKEIEKRRDEESKAAVEAEAKRKADEVKAITDLIGDANKQITDAGLSAEEARLAALRRVFTTERLQGLNPRERNEVEDQLRAAEAAVKELERIRARPEAVRRAFRDAFAPKEQPAAEANVTPGGSLGAFQSAGFRQALGGTGDVAGVRATALGVARTNSILLDIKKVLERARGVFA